jgi:hypothetical protein
VEQTLKEAELIKQSKQRVKMHEELKKSIQKVINSPILGFNARRACAI